MDMNASQLSLEQQRKRLELVIEGTRLGMWDWNPQTNEVAFNDIWAQMLGFELSEITPALEEWEKRVHPDDIASCFADIQAHMEGKTEFYENVHRMKHRDGHWVYILDRGKVVEWDSENKPIRFTGTHTDVSKQREAEEAALKSTKAKSLFLANMSHEIRTPLTGILGVAELLKKTNLDERQIEFTDIIFDCSEGLLSTLNDILDLSKLETGKITFSPHSFEVEKILQHSCQLFQDQALRKDLDFIVEIDSSITNIIADPNRLRQVIGNIISNAIKFTQAGFVKISTSYANIQGKAGDLVIKISDSGVGIANPARIWQSFEQDDTTIASQYGGTGLGLTISKELLELMGGQVQVTSKVGKGSEFTVTLPIEFDAESEQKIEKLVSVNSNLSQINILIAEDNPINQLIISEFLMDIDAKFTIVENGLEAVNICKQDTFDLIFMDLHMPKLNGINAVKAIRALPDIVQPDIYALTADAMSDVNQECLVVGMQGVLHKPFNNDQLLDVINKTCTK